MNLLVVEKGAVDATLSLTNLCSLMVFCLLTASMSQFLDKCFQKGMIFRKYYNLIFYHLWLPRKKLIRKEFVQPIGFSAMCGVGEIQKSHWETSIKFTPNKYQWLFKILGGCIYCFSTWIYILIVLSIVAIIEIDATRPVIILLFLGVGGNYLFIEVIQKLKHGKS